MHAKKFQAGVHGRQWARYLRVISQVHKVEIGQECREGRRNRAS